MSELSMPLESKASTTRPRTWLRVTIVVTALGLIAAGLVGFHQFKSGILRKVTADITSQRPIVATATASLETWQDTLTATGSLRASRGVDLSAELPGIIDELHIDSGRDVAAGTVLLRLRSNDDPAKLEQLQAAADLAAITYKRDAKQLKAQAIAQSTVDSDAATLRSDRAQVAAQQAVMAEKIVRAPFAGRLGIRQVDIGQYLAVGTAIVSLQALDPIYADVYVPQDAVGRLRSGQKVALDAGTGETFSGQVSAINSLAESGSRMVQARISVSNPRKLLLPGMYVTAEIAASEPRKRVTVPVTAVSVNPYGDFVYLVQPANGADGEGALVVRQQFVTVGDTRGDQVAIATGVKAGDCVVIAGQLKLHKGASVVIDNSVLPSGAAAPIAVDR
jgi:membrane fusion protein (multidrug efflux system)